MLYRIKKYFKFNTRYTIAAILFCFGILFYSCKNKQHHTIMTEKKTEQPPIATGRLLSVANLEQTDSSRNVIAWFFETPQIFEFSLETEQAQQNFSLLKEAKEKQQPVNVRYTSSSGKNLITLIIPATLAQLNQFNKEKSNRAEPVRMPPPPNK